MKFYICKTEERVWQSGGKPGWALSDLDDKWGWIVKERRWINILDFENDVPKIVARLRAVLK